MRRRVRRLAAGCVMLGVLGLAGPAHSAEFTDILDAADDMDDYDEDTYDPFDFNFEPTFMFETGRAQIDREAPCVPPDQNQNEVDKSNPRIQGSQGRCDEVGLVDNKEMLYRHQEARLEFDARFGIYKDLEINFNVPVVFNSVHGLKYANEASRESQNVKPGNSDVDPTESRIEGNADCIFGGEGQNCPDAVSNREAALNRLNRFKTHRYFDLGSDFTNFSRAGLDHPTVGAEWAPFNDQRDDTKATLTIGMDYTIPLGKNRQWENDAVGDGLHKLKWTLGASKQYDWVDPYFGLDYTLSMAARGSPIKELEEVDPNNGGQSVTAPPHRGNITLGTEFIPDEDEEKGTRYAIDLRFNFGYVSEGRQYTPLFEHLTQSKCNGRSRNEVLPNFEGGSYQGPGGVECSWIAQRPANVRPTGDAEPEPAYDIGRNLEEGDHLRTNGIMTSESYAKFGGHLGIYLQPSEYFQFKAIGGILHRQEHYLTNARTGNDVEQEKTKDEKVDLTGPDAKLERNPAYNSTYDSPGTRFRINQWNTWTIMTTAAVQF